MKISNECKNKKLNEPFKSNRKYKKFDVCVKDKDNIKKISFGDNRYEDYTQHKDKQRRKSFRARHACDLLTKRDMNTPRWWSCNKLW